MSARPNLFKIGLFVIVGAALLVAGLFAFGLRGLIEPKYRLETAVEGDVEGLAVGSPVKVRGVPVGEVTQIGFTWNEYPGSKADLAIVRFVVRQRIAPGRAKAEVTDALQEGIKHGWRARVKSQGITGSSMVALEPLDLKAYPIPVIDFTPRDIYVPSAPTELSQLLDSVQATIKHIEQLDLAPVLTDARAALKSIDEAAQSVGRMDVPRLGKRADVLLVDLAETNRQLKSLVATAERSVAGLRLPEAGTTLNKLLVELRTTNQQLKGSIESVGRVDIPALNGTVADLRKAVRSLDQAIDDLQSYPSGFLFGTPPQQAKSVEPARATGARK